MLFLPLLPHAQLAENLVVITTDGLRWQEVFKGMSPLIARDSLYNEEDSAYLFRAYGGIDEKERRKKLMPFLWRTIAAEGQLLGNRELGNKMDNANPYWFSYPGYNELMTGYPDTLINSNNYPPNPHMNVLEFLNLQPALKGKVAAFGAWNAFDRILNEGRSGFPVVNGFDTVAGKALTARQQLINDMLRNSYRPWGDAECLDVFTHYAAMEYLRTKRPRVLYIAYGETDEWAHAGKYRSYLDAARQVDKWIEEVWTFIQNDPKYRNKTALLLTTDHGRGNQQQWTDHGSRVAGASSIWLAAIGPGVIAKGEAHEEQQLYQMQLAQTMAKWLGYTFRPQHPVAEEIKTLLAR